MRIYEISLTGYEIADAMKYDELSYEKKNRHTLSVAEAFIYEKNYYEPKFKRLENQVYI